MGPTIFQLERADILKCNQDSVPYLEESQEPKVFFIKASKHLGQSKIADEILSVTICDLYFQYSTYFTRENKKEEISSRKLAC